MHDQAFTALEYDELRRLVRRHAQTPMGQSLADNLAPLSDVDVVRRALAAVSECVTLNRSGAPWSFADLADPTESLAILHIEGATLEPLKQLDVARLCEAAGVARGALSGVRDECPVLWEITADLPRDLSDLARRVFAKILPSGELDDRASPELASIRARISRLRSDIARALERLMKRMEEAIQDQLVTVRNDRFVIPVRADHRGRVAGVAHSFSSSGQTVFIEPLETIDANNDLQALREHEANETARIIFTLTEDLRAHLPAIERAARVVSQLDFINAKTRLAVRLDCVEPEVSRETELELIEARHPLLEENLRQSGAHAVPVSFALDPQHPVMVISGANAGGKTVVLKTAGLLALMTLSGLHVPAKRARVPFYRVVLADIGDSQSLAANLSTFTAHVSNIRRMIDSCESPSLVLLDEVGTGTDPEEGSALGVAVVDHFRHSCAAHVVATTHYSGLKMYAANDDAVINASVEFDEQTLQPTYRLLVGLAGSSSGLEIARRFGFPNSIVRSARELVSSQTLDATDYLARIKREADTAEAGRRALEEERAAVAEKYQTLDAEARRLERERQAQFEKELQAATRDFERRSQDLINKIEDRAARTQVEREAEKRAAELRREAQQAARLRSSAAAAAAAPRIPAPGNGVRVVRNSPNQPATNQQAAAADFDVSRPVVVRDQVRLRTLGTTGVVESIKGDDVEVRVGTMRLREKLGNIDLIAQPAEQQQPPAVKRGARLQQAMSRGTEAHIREAEDAPTTELNLIGRTTDEGVDSTDKFLDEAYLHSLSRIRIIHGHGTGALRRAIHSFLKNHPHVASFTQAPPDQGGAGATIVELKQ